MNRSLTLCMLTILPTYVGAQAPRLITIAEARDEIARHSEGSMLELKDGKLLLIWQEFKKGKGDSDFFPGRLVAKTSRDGGLTWDGFRVVVENLKGDINVFSPSLLRLPDGSILFCFMRYHSFDKAKNRYPPASAFAWLSRDEGQTFTPLASRTRAATSSHTNVAACPRCVVSYGVIPHT